MLDPNVFKADGPTVGFRKRMHQEVDWDQFNKSLQTQDCVKTRRELKETPINVIHCMGGAKFGIEQNGVLGEYARQQRQMSGYPLRSFTSNRLKDVLPKTYGGRPNELVGNNTQFQYVSTFTEPLTTPLENEDALRMRQGFQALSNSLTNPSQALNFLSNLHSTQQQILINNKKAQKVKGYTQKGAVGMPQPLSGPSFTALSAQEQLDAAAEYEKNRRIAVQQAEEGFIAYQSLQNQIAISGSSASSKSNGSGDQSFKGPDVTPSNLYATWLQEQNGVESDQGFVVENAGGTQFGSVNLPELSNEIDFSNDITYQNYQDTIDMLSDNIEEMVSLLNQQLEDLKAYGAGFEKGSAERSQVKRDVKALATEIANEKQNLRDDIERRDNYAAKTKLKQLQYNSEGFNTTDLTPIKTSGGLLYENEQDKLGALSAHNDSTAVLVQKSGGDGFGGGQSVENQFSYASFESQIKSGLKNKLDLALIAEYRANSALTSTTDQKLYAAYAAASKTTNGNGMQAQTLTDLSTGTKESPADKAAQTLQRLLRKKRALQPITNTNI